MEITVHSAQLVESASGQTWMIALEVNDPDNDDPPQMVASLIPTDAMEWRTAEYGLDDLDEDEVLEAIIREPYADIDHTGPDGVFNAPTVERARAHYLGCIEKQKAKGQLKRAAKAKPAKLAKPGKGMRTLAAEPEPAPVPKCAGPAMNVLVDSDGDDPFEVMRKHTPRRPEHVAARRVITEKNRRDHKARQHEDRDTLVMREAIRLQTEENI